MFDTYRVSPSRISVNTTVTEKRAATDDSVRLLKEMEEKARERIVESMILPNNLLSGTVHRQHDIINMAIYFHVHYQLNNVKREARTRVIDGGRESIGENIEAIYKALSEDIARILISESLFKNRMDSK